MIVNILTGYTVKYFNVLYMAIACIYVIAAILIIRSDIIKQQIELSKIMQEQENIIIIAISTITLGKSEKKNFRLSILYEIIALNS